MSRSSWLIAKLIFLVLSFLIVVGISIRIINYPGLSRSAIEIVQEESFSNVEKIVVESISLPVRIYESDTTKVIVTEKSTIYGKETSSLNIIAKENGVLSIKQRKRKNVSFLSFRSGDITIEVPRGSVLEYDINSVSGSINHDAMSKEMLTTETISGSVKIHQGAERVLASSISGSVSVRAGQDSKQISASSISGSVKIQLENVTGYEMDYQTVSGSVKDTYENIDYSKSGRVAHGDGSLKINASSVSGSIKLADWE